MSPYERVAKIIRYLDKHHTEQPTLTTLARQAGLSEFHFHRLFSSWAGITPKDFLQALTLSHAKARLQAGQSVLASALESGLSGPGRLHDLCVHLEAASPGELKAAGDGLKIQAGVTDSPFGKCLLAQSPRGICHLSFMNPNKEKSHWQELQQQWANAKIARDDAGACKLAAKIFTRPVQTGRRDVPAGRLRTMTAEDARSLLVASQRSVSLRAYVRGTPFQIKVWRALLQVKPGALTSYGHLAAAIGQPQAARAVGTAVGRNPIAYLIPCHRVIRETGALGNYRWGGLIRKSAMIAWECTS